VNRIGKIRITQMLVPFVAWMEEIPNKAISEDVSNPRPKSTPSGYIFHGLKSLVSRWSRKIQSPRKFRETHRSISLNIFFRT
jgi:hypothetical protein